MEDKNASEKNDWQAGEDASGKRGGDFHTFCRHRLGLLQLGGGTRRRDQEEEDIFFFFWMAFGLAWGKKGFKIKKKRVISQ